ncbi:Wadjet anti-phage system protein JetD domain-containing protein [Gordonia terrae]|nr:Wadjet anti-phage system protein JetD domain-containing protein [Gordonia terrae]
MRAPDDIRVAVGKYLQNTWPTTIADIADKSWPKTWTLLAEKTPGKSILDNLTHNAATTRVWSELAQSQPGLELDTKTWRVMGGQTLAQRLTIANATAAAQFVRSDAPYGEPRRWSLWLSVAQRRAGVLRTTNPALSDTAVAHLLASTAAYSDIDFDLLNATATWFTHNPGATQGLTARQVPVPGVHAKWLNTHHRQLEALSGLTKLDLEPNHPPRIQFTYLDHSYLASGRRRYDMYTMGDTSTPAYQPQVVLISENKDTAVRFPRVERGIAVEGNGKEGPSRLKNVDWIRSCSALIYWGDIDSTGFTILNNYRELGMSIVSIMMDFNNFRDYAMYGTSHHPNGEPIKTTQVELPHLTDAERAAYRAINSADAPCRRVEQERIPLLAARQRLQHVRDQLG